MRLAGMHGVRMCGCALTPRSSSARGRGDASAMWCSRHSLGPAGFGKYPPQELRFCDVVFEALPLLRSRARGREDRCRARGCPLVDVLGCAREFGPPLHGRGSGGEGQRNASCYRSARRRSDSRERGSGMYSTDGRRCAVCGYSPINWYTSDGISVLTGKPSSRASRTLIG